MKFPTSKHRATPGTGKAAVLVAFLALAQGMSVVLPGQQRETRGQPCGESELSGETRKEGVGEGGILETMTNDALGGRPLPDVSSIALPPGLMPPFILENLTYTEEESADIAATLASVELEFFDSPGLRQSLRERATFLAAFLRPDHADAIRAYAKLTAPGTAGEDLSLSDRVDRFKGTEELSFVLTLAAKPIGSAGASFDDLVLSTHILDLASKLDPANNDATERLADLRAAGHLTRWDLIAPAPGNAAATPPPLHGADAADTAAEEESEVLRMVELQRWKSAASSLVLEGRGAKDRGSRMPLVTALVVLRPQGGVPTIDHGEGRQRSSPKAKSRGKAGEGNRPMEIQMVTDGTFELLALFASVEGFVQSRFQNWPSDRDIEIAYEGGYPSENHSLQEATCALLLDSLLSNRPLDSSVLAYGDLDDRGNFLPVESFPIVISEAANHLLPGQTLVVGTVHESGIHDALLLYGPAVFLKAEVIAAKTFDRLVEVAESPQWERIRAARRLFHEFQQVAARMRQPERFLKTDAAKTRLGEIVKILPDHVSATALLQYAEGTHAPKVTLRGAFDFVEWMNGPALHYASLDSRTFREEEALQLNAGTVARVQRLRPKFRKEIYPMIDNFVDLGEAVIDYGTVADPESRAAREALQRRKHYLSRYNHYRSRMRAYLEAQPAR